MTTIDVRTPDDERAAQVATALLADPADGRTLAYETPSAFVAAFRRETGLTPAAYFRAGRPGP